MTKKITIPGIITVIIFLYVISALPNETTTDSKSAVKNAAESYKTDKAISATQEVVNQVGNQAIETSCKDGTSQACTTAHSTQDMSSATLGIILFAIFVAAVIGFARWIIMAINSLMELFGIT